MGYQIEPNATRIVVIGNGMVGHRFCEEIRALDPSGSFCVTVLGEEARPAYDRVKLTSYFTASSADELGLADESRAAMPVPPVRITVFTSPVSQLASTSSAIALASSGTT